MKEVELLEPHIQTFCKGLQLVCCDPAVKSTDEQILPRNKDDTGKEINTKKSHAFIKVLF